MALLLDVLEFQYFSQLGGADVVSKFLKAQKGFSPPGGAGSQYPAFMCHFGVTVKISTLNIVFMTLLDVT